VRDAHDERRPDARVSRPPPQDPLTRRTALSCHGSSLAPGWWRDEQTLRDELAEHGGDHAVARAHGCNQTTITKWRGKFGIPAAERRGRVEQPREEERAEERLRAEISYLRRENTALRKERVNRDAILDQILEAARLPAEVPRLAVARPPKKLPVRSAVLPVYDVQYGQLVRREDTPLGVGGFSEEVFDRRLARWLEAVSGSMRDYAASHRIAELVIPFGGDLVEGDDIFSGQPWQLEIDPARQTVAFVRKWTAALETLLRFAKEELGVERTMILFVPGNHGKVGGKRKGATPSTYSWDWLAAEWLRDSLRGWPVDEWAVEPGGALLFETAGHLFLTIHGDEVKGWGGLPFYGLSKYDGRAIRLSGEVYDYCLLGHHHQPASIPNGSGGEFIVSGDWVGGNNLSRFLASASRPQQRLLFVGEKYGVTEQIPIYLDPEWRRERPRIHRTT
jgi:hypothetical protein